MQREHFVDHCQVVDTAGNRTEVIRVDVVLRLTNTIDVAPLRHRAERGLEPVDATEMRREPDRATEIGTDLERGETGARGGRGTARRSAGLVIGVPRIARG